MAIDFPNTPALNDEFSAEGRTWIWNGYAWDSVGTVLEEGPVGPQGPQGIQGPPGNLDNLNVSSPITYDLGTSTVGFAGIALDDVTDVSAATPTTGDQLTWNGTAWIPQADPVPTDPAWEDITGKPSLIESSLIDAAGDLIVGTADNTAGKLSLGTSGSIVVSNGSTVTWLPLGPNGNILQSNGSVAAWGTLPSPSTTYTVNQSQYFSEETFEYSKYTQILFEVTQNLPGSTTVLFADFYNSSSSLLSRLSISTNGYGMVAPFLYSIPTGTSRIIFRNLISSSVSFSMTGITPKSIVPKDVIILTSSGSITTTKAYNCYVIGGGGGGGGGIQTYYRSGGGGGGSGRLASGTLPIGTYSYTIGAGGAGGYQYNNGAVGGSSSIHTFTATGGNGGIQASSNTVAGAGGAGGSGGGGGSSSTTAVAGGLAGTMGANGSNGTGNQTNGAGGTGSGVSYSSPLTLVYPPGDTIYRGGSGGEVRAGNNGGTGNSGTYGSGGNGAPGGTVQSDNSAGGNGGNGIIFLVESL